MSVAEKDIKSEVKSVTISLQQELARRAELEAMRRDLLASAREDEEIKKRVQASKDKKLALADRLLALINN
jgi:hypothetical protein